MNCMCRQKIELEIFKKNWKDSFACDPDLLQLQDETEMEWQAIVLLLFCFAASSSVEATSRTPRSAIRAAANTCPELITGSLSGVRSLLVANGVASFPSCAEVFMPSHANILIRSFVDGSRRLNATLHSLFQNAELPETASIIVRKGHALAKGGYNEANQSTWEAAQEGGNPKGSGVGPCPGCLNKALFESTQRAHHTSKALLNQWADKCASPPVRALAVPPSSTSAAEVDAAIMKLAEDQLSCGTLLSAVVDAVDALAIQSCQALLWSSNNTEGGVTAILARCMLLSSNRSEGELLSAVRQQTCFSLFLIEMHTTANKLSQFQSQLRESLLTTSKVSAELSLQNQYRASVCLALFPTITKNNTQKCHQLCQGSCHDLRGIVQLARDFVDFQRVPSMSLLLRAVQSSCSALATNISHRCAHVTESRGNLTLVCASSQNEVSCKPYPQTKS